jgi:hypothetical protein
MDLFMILWRLEKKRLYHLPERGLILWFIFLVYFLHVSIAIYLSIWHLYAPNSFQCIYSPHSNGVAGSHSWLLDHSTSVDAFTLGYQTQAGEG